MSDLLYLVEVDRRGFAVRIDGANRPISVHPTERDAIMLAQSLARGGSTVRVVSRSTVPPAPSMNAKQRVA